MTSREDEVHPGGPAESAGRPVIGDPTSTGSIPILARRSGVATMPPWTAAHALAAYEATKGRLCALEIALPASNRLDRCARTLEQGVLGPRWAEASRTLLEAYLISTATEQADAALRERLTWLLSGADLAADDSNGTARDVQFELFVAAALAHGGVLGVRLCEPDVRIRAGEAELGVAVKRVQSARKSTRRVREAVRQIRGQGLTGFIVLNLDRLVEHLPPLRAREVLRTTVLDARRLIASLRREDVVGGVVGFATTVTHTPVPDRRGAVGALTVGFDAQFIAHPADDADHIGRRLAQIGRNVVLGVGRAIRALDGRALDIVVQDNLP